ncbi:MAG TPA: shikimate kinase [Rhodanobacteraceae bacterium]|nr:shikimate kinase [Rhodanobacteraceae bacterium]
MNPSPNLFLIGPMGAGKSTLGRRLARHFGLPCVDLDATIEARTGATITTIFEVEGEAGFRARESKLLAELAARDGIVLATGGGAVLADANRALLTARGFVVWLETSVTQQLRRLARDHQRPLLDAPDRRGRLEQLARERDPIYRALADLVVPNADGEPFAAFCGRITQLLEHYWRRAEPVAAR